MKDLSSFREEYTRGELLESDVFDNPMLQFDKWLQLAIDSKLLEPNAMVLATSTLEGKPSARVVLLKEINQEGFVFFTNYQSRKGHEIMTNPFVSLVFDWHEIEKQVRVEGVVSQLSELESDSYFNSRPRLAKISASVSPQSQLLNGREQLEQMKELYLEAVSDSPIVRPKYWGGFLVEPTVIEFWQGRANRLHDRLLYTKTQNGWMLSRLAP